ncbi:MAG: hypothetical protein ACXWJW_15030 [Xanthobacteraceae bacterium]
MSTTTSTATPSTSTPQRSKTSDDTRFALALGDATIALWPNLPQETQKLIFEAAVEANGEASREPLALFLHDAHPRTERARAK